MGKPQKLGYHCRADIRNARSASKKGRGAVITVFTSIHHIGSLRNCVPKSSSFSRTETLILNISFNYNYSSSSSPKIQRYLSRHIRPLRATVTNLFSFSLAYPTISKTLLWVDTLVDPYMPNRLNNFLTYSICRG